MADGECAERMIQIFDAANDGDWSEPRLPEDAEKGGEGGEAKQKSPDNVADKRNTRRQRSKQ